MCLLWMMGFLKLLYASTEEILFMENFFACKLYCSHRPFEKPADFE